MWEWETKRMYPDISVLIGLVAKSKALNCVFEDLGSNPARRDVFFDTRFLSYSPVKENRGGH